MKRPLEPPRHSSFGLLSTFGLRHSDFSGHSGFVIRISLGIRFRHSDFCLLGFLLGPRPHRLHAAHQLVASARPVGPDRQCPRKSRGGSAGGQLPISVPDTPRKPRFRGRPDCPERFAPPATRSAGSISSAECPPARNEMDQAALKALADSIRTSGISSHRRPVGPPSEANAPTLRDHAANAGGRPVGRLASADRGPRGHPTSRCRAGPGRETSPQDLNPIERAWATANTATTSSSPPTGRPTVGDDRPP